MELLDLSRELMRRCDDLGAISEEPGRLTRTFASSAMQRANNLVSSWMREAGMQTREDAAFNYEYLVRLREDIEKGRRKQDPGGGKLESPLGSAATPEKAAGDMKNFTVGKDGKAKTGVVNANITMNDSTHSVFTGGGTATMNAADTGLTSVTLVNAATGQIVRTVNTGGRTFAQVAGGRGR